MRAHGDRIRGDALMLVDGPRHASERPTMYFGARGIMNAIVTVYGPARDLHSGNYGNWAPNPGARPGEAAGVDEGRQRPRQRSTASTTMSTPLTAEERRAIDEIPDVAPTLMQAFGFSRPETHPSGSSGGTTCRR